MDLDKTGYSLCGNQIEGKILIVSKNKSCTDEQHNNFLKPSKKYPGRLRIVLSPLFFRICRHAAHTAIS